MALKINAVEGSSAVSMAAAVTAFNTAIATVIAAVAPEELAPVSGGGSVAVGPLYSIVCIVQYQG